VLSYAGWRKPAWFALRRAFGRVPFYANSLRARGFKAPLRRR
jgi:hypothetical protein